MRVPALLTAPAKLTLSLRIVGVRADGYHLVDAEMVSLDLVDDIELMAGSGVEVVGGSGLSVPAGSDNLVAKALRSLDVDVRAVITKRIPAGAGLGGGSSDAAAVLAWAGVADTAAAARLGADVAFCLRGGRARVTGIGEEILQLPSPDLTVTLLTPPIGVSTPLVYDAWDSLGGPSGDNGNDLEPAALSAFPELGEWREEFAELAGARPRLAGSGGTWFVEGALDGEVRGVQLRVLRSTQPRGTDGGEKPT